MSQEDQGVVLLAAQPIFDRHHRVSGVELLYRNEAQQSALEVGEDRATAELLFNFCTGVSEQAEQFRAPAFINVSASFLQSRSFLPISPDKVVIELVERIEPTPELIASIRHWHRQGFRFALDDFEFGASWNPILEYASIIKVDVSQIRYEDAVRRKRELSGLDVMWLAERIEDEADRNRYFDAGFDLFQGYFFARPSLVYGRKMKPSGLQLLRLISELSRAEKDAFGIQFSLKRLVQIISEDPHLVIKLLKIANSSFYRSQIKIANIRQVILRFGISNLKKWVMLFGLLEFSAIENARLVLIRASVCERMVRARLPAGMGSGRGYLAGLLTGVALLYDVDSTQFINQLPIDEHIRNAVLLQQGELGQLVAEVLDAEHKIIQKLDINGIDPDLLRAFQEAAEEVSHMIQEARGSSW